MIKAKVTERQIKEGYRNIITISYCAAQNLLRYKNPIFYTCGTYGWKSDIYQINYNTIISTGYAPVNGIRNYELVREYEQKASKINHNYSIEYEKQQELVNKLLDEFIEKILEGNK